MKIHFLVLFCLFQSLQMFGQGLIRGKILDHTTSEPIPGVNIYLNNSQIGTVSEIDGSFSLEVLFEGNVKLFFSHIGFKTIQATVDVSKVKSLKVLLEEDDTQLSEVEVSARRDKTWERQLKKFERLFLGNDKFARSCEILNPWVIEFQETRQRFSATAGQVLNIQNNATGYKVAYYLEDFILEDDMILYNGLASFQSLEPADRTQFVSWEKNRKSAYNGSFAHFLKSVLDDQVEANGFEAHLVTTESDQNTKMLYDKFRGFDQQATKALLFTEKDGKRYLDFSNTLRINYYDSEVTLQNQFSYIRLVRPVAVDDRGNIEDVAALMTFGSMSKEGFPYLMPLDYVSDGKKSSLTQFNNAIVRPFSRYNSSKPIEKLHVHTDKDLYLNSETIWFKAYVNVNDQPGKFSNKLFVQLLKDENAYLKTIVPVENGIAYGSIPLNKDLQDGEYTLKAYTSWSETLEDRFHYQKQVQIGLAGNDKNDNTDVSEVSYRVRAFPEGGHLINGVENRVAFEIINDKGQFVNTPLVLMDGQGKELQTVFPDWYGKGSVVFKPSDKKSYRLVVKSQPAMGTSLEATAGLEVAMQVTETEELLKLTLRSSDKSQKPVNVLLTAGGTVRYFTSVVLEKEETMEIDQSLLADGINQVTVFDYQYQPIAERLYFKIPQQSDLELTVDQGAKWKRGKTVVNLAGTDTIRSASISVISNNLSYTKDEHSVIFSNYLKPHISGNIMGLTDQLLDLEATRKRLDLLMLVNGWRQYDWDEIRKSEKVEQQTLVLQEGIDIKGALINKLNGKPFSNVPLYLLINDSKSAMTDVITDEEGRFVFENIFYSDSSELIFKVLGKVKGQNQMKFAFDPLNWNSSVPSLLDGGYLTISSDESVGMSSLDRDELLKLSNYDGKTYLLKDAVVVGEKEQALLAVPRIYSFPNNREKVVLDSIAAGGKISTQNIINRNFPSVRFEVYLVPGEGRVYVLRLASNNSSLSSPTGMSVYVDNFPVDAEYLYFMNPLEIETMEVLRGPNAAITGANSASGAIVIYTKRNQAQALEKLPNFYQTKLKGYHQYKAFYSPDYSVLKDPMPDMRTTLYWNPLLTDSDRTIEFYNSDITGKFQVIIEGFTEEGKPFRTVDYYQVGESQ